MTSNDLFYLNIESFQNVYIPSEYVYGSIYHVGHKWTSVFPHNLTIKILTLLTNVLKYVDTFT
jgi:hypothetical protein